MRLDIAGGPPKAQDLAVWRWGALSRPGTFTRPDSHEAVDSHLHRIHTTYREHITRRDTRERFGLEPGGSVGVRRSLPINKSGILST
jgi:hypothetical protein